MDKLINLIREDRFRMNVLSIVSSLNLPDWYIGAGFVRNLVWDHLHDFSSTPLNDIDVLYFSKESLNEEGILNTLCSAFPLVTWQLKNQATMHERNLDSPYRNSLHAMEYWPEIETAVGVKLGVNNEIVVASPFTIESLFLGHITHNKNRKRATFLNRIEEKNWLEIWPKLKVQL